MITLLVGTNRPDSSTRLVARQIETLYAELNQPLRVLDLAQLPPEIFAPSAYAEKPASFAPFADGVLASAGLHVVTPEYNGSMPGVLKYFIDMLKFPESFDPAARVLHGAVGGHVGRAADGGAAPANLRLPQRAHLPGARLHSRHRQPDGRGWKTQGRGTGRAAAQTGGGLRGVHAPVRDEVRSGKRSRKHMVGAGLEPPRLKGTTTSKKCHHALLLAFPSATAGVAV